MRFRVTLINTDGFTVAWIHHDVSQAEMRDIVYLVTEGVNPMQTDQQLVIERTDSG